MKYIYMRKELTEKSRFIESYMSWKPSTESGNHKHHKKPETTFDSHSGNLKLPHKTVVKDTKPNNSIKKNIILIGDSMLNGLHEKGFKNHKVTN